MTRFAPIAVTLATLTLAAPAFAAGSSGSADTTTPPTATETSTQCAAGQIFDTQSQSCLDVKSEVFTDDDLYEAARELAYAGDYERTLEVLAEAEDQNDPRILNYYGFTNRKMGNTDAAMTYYQAALEVDPGYILARSYMGQGMAASGDIAGAEAQLVQIAALGGEDTWAYASLHKAIGGEQSDY